MNIGIFGGTFNPPHKGHIYTAKTLIDQGLLDEVLFMVTATPPHKEYVDTSALHRFEMTKLATSDKNIKACDFEIKKGGKSYTYNTLSQLKEMYPKDNIIFIMGADMFMDMPTWYEADKLRKEFEFIVIDRKGAFDNEVFKEFSKKQIADFNMKVKIVDIETPDISSTKIREWVKNNKSIAEYVGKDVEDYIIKNNLYKQDVSVDEIIEILKGKLSEKRFCHSKNVAEVSVNLAKHYKADEDMAYLAGFAHDIAKEISLDEMNELTLHLDMDSHIRSKEALLHGPAGACLLKKLFNISEDIYNACYYHTMGRENMTMLEKIIFIADYIEPSRNFKGVEEIRRLAYEDLDRAIVVAINSTLDFLVKNNKRIYYKTILTRNFYIKQ